MRIGYGPRNTELHPGLIRYQALGLNFWRHAIRIVGTSRWHLSKQSAKIPDDMLYNMLICRNSGDKLNCLKTAMIEWPKTLLSEQIINSKAQFKLVIPVERERRFWEAMLSSIDGEALSAHFEKKWLVSVQTKRLGKQGLDPYFTINVRTPW